MCDESDSRPKRLAFSYRVEPEDLDGPIPPAEHRGRIELVSGSSGAVFVLALPVAEPCGVIAGYLEVATNAA